MCDTTTFIWWRCMIMNMINAWPYVVLSIMRQCNLCWTIEFWFLNFFHEFVDICTTLKFSWMSLRSYVVTWNWSRYNLIVCLEDYYWFKDNNHAILPNASKGVSNLGKFSHYRVTVRSKKHTMNECISNGTWSFFKIFLLHDVTEVSIVVQIVHLTSMIVCCWNFDRALGCLSPIHLFIHIFGNLTNSRCKMTNECA